MTNGSTSSQGFAYSFTCTGGTSCTLVSEPDEVLGPGASGLVKLSVTVGGANGVVKVKAIGAVQDSGWKNVTCTPW